MIHRLQVFWINQIPSVPYARIAHVAGRNPDGSRWELSAAEALAAMQSGLLSLYLIRDGRIHDIVALEAAGQQYLTCLNDELPPGCLSALPGFQPGRSFRIGGGCES